MAINLKTFVLFRMHIFTADCDDSLIFKYAVLYDGAGQNNNSMGATGMEYVHFVLGLVMVLALALLANCRNWKQKIGRAHV